MSILSGRKIPIQDAPYMVWIEEIVSISEGKAYECGGSIIKDRVGPNGRRVSKFILTAAHCVVDDDNKAKGPESFLIVAGSNNKVTAVQNGKVNYVSKVEVHPSYNGPDTPHDIAILELKEDLVLDGKFKKAIKLAGVNEKFPVGTECLAAGFGTNPNTTNENYLYQTTLKVRSYSKCAEEYGDNPNNPITEESLKEHQICALGDAPDYSNVCKVFNFDWILLKLEINFQFAGRLGRTFGKEIKWSSNWTCLLWAGLSFSSEYTLSFGDNFHENRRQLGFHQRKYKLLELFYSHINVYIALCSVIIKKVNEI